MGSKKLCAEDNYRAFTSLRALTTFCIVSTVYVLYVCVHLCVKKFAFDSCIRMKLAVACLNRKLPACSIIVRDLPLVLL